MRWYACSGVSDPQFCLSPTDVAGAIGLPEGPGMAMSSDNAEMTVEIVTFARRDLFYRAVSPSGDQDLETSSLSAEGRAAMMA